MQIKYKHAVRKLMAHLYVTISPEQLDIFRHPKRPRFIPFHIHVLALTWASILAAITMVLFSPNVKLKESLTMSSLLFLPDGDILYLQKGDTLEKAWRKTLKWSRYQI